MAILNSGVDSTEPVKNGHADSGISGHDQFGMTGHIGGIGGHDGVEYAVALSDTSMSVKADARSLGSKVHLSCT